MFRDIQKYNGEIVWEYEREEERNGEKLREMERSGEKCREVERKLRILEIYL